MNPDQLTDDVVILSVPANGSYLAVLRTATAGLAARLQLGLDEIEDLRIAVDEACAILLPMAAAGADVTCKFGVTPSALSIDVSVPVRPGQILPGTESFSWQVLTALAGQVAAITAEGVAVIQLTKKRGS
jgi:serine/threonine-protein kinase RsbW